MQLIIFFNTLRNLQGEKVHICVFFFFPHPCSCHLLTASPSGVVVLARLCGHWAYARAQCDKGTL